MVGWRHEWRDGRNDGWMVGYEKKMNGWMNEKKHGWIDTSGWRKKWIHRCIERRMDEWVDK